MIALFQMMISDCIFENNLVDLNVDNLIVKVNKMLISLGLLSHSQMQIIWQ